MTTEIQLRRATLDDAEDLFTWRNDPLTREASHSSDVVEKSAHLIWLKSILADENRLLFIAEKDGVPVGTVRADVVVGVYHLSWTIAPGARGSGIGKLMVAQYVQSIAAPIRAEVKSGNHASMRIAEYAGLRLEREEDGVLYYVRENP